MIIINAVKPKVESKEPEKSLSHKNHLRRAKEDSEKKMSLEKSQRLKAAGLAK